MVQAAPLRPPFPNHTRSPPHPRSHTTAGAHPRVTRDTVRGSFTAPFFARRHTTAGAYPRVTRGTVRGSFTAPFFARRSALHGDDSACACAQRFGSHRQLHKTQDMKTEAVFILAWASGSFRALKWKYLLPQLLLKAPIEPRQAAAATSLGVALPRFRGEVHDRTYTVVALVEDGELSRAAGRLSSKGTGDLSDPAILAQLRDKHPSRSHPIPDAADDIPVDEAAMTVDMRVPYQQLKQHVAAGPFGMRNEYLRCLVGEYAPASGPAAVRAMSEVASMYLQGRLPGWFNLLFASARLVAHVKKLGEGRAPDVRHVAVGEAERRVAERAVVDNMKEAYVSVLAPSQLGVGIPAGDSMLIHGVRLIAEKLGPRAVIVHTDLRKAYTEAWRRTIIQRHIDCSPLHHVIPALLASLSSDSYPVVDDRSAPLRSEDGVQQGAPLATTYFCVAVHPEVHQCDITLEVTDGAAHFNADDGFLVDLPEHVWPALHAFRTSIKASVGLEVRFDKI
eukprot:jgi/Tetstr1/439106/TSEL_002971.t1